MRTLRRTITLAAATVGLATSMFGIAAFLGPQPGGPPSPVAPPSRGATVPAAAAGAADSVAGLVGGLQAHLAAQPKVGRSLAQLGLAYVEQARITSDPMYYPKAQRALERSLDVLPQDNDTALVGLSALAAGRHDFAAAADQARAALAINPDSAEAHGVLSDAMTELGRYDAGLAEARRMDDLRPSLSSRARLSYHRELRGDLPAARKLLTDALVEPLGAGDTAYVHGLLGDLDWSSGKFGDASRHYSVALAAVPGYVPAMFGTARTDAAHGNLDKAIGLAATVAARQPTIEHLQWYGELLDAAGRKTDARRQYELARAGADLQRAQGVTLDLEVALFEADHGDPTAALTAGRSAVAARPSVFAEDAYAWALHVAGKDDEALVHARKAARLGTRNARLDYHTGMIELSLGRTAAARTHLARALALNPAFSALDAPRAAAALQRLGGAK